MKNISLISLYKLEKVVSYASYTHNDTPEQRLEKIIISVNYFASIYKMSDTFIHALAIKSVIYSYEKNGEALCNLCRDAIENMYSRCKHAKECCICL